MYNLAAQRVQALTLITGERLKASPQTPPASLDMWINEGYLEIQTAARLVKKTFNQNAVAGQSVYDFPTDLLDNVFDKRALRIKSGTPNCFSFPEERTQDYMLENYGDFTNPDARYGPMDWFISPDDPRQFIVMFPPQVAVVDGVSLFYTTIPVPISRVADATGIGATLTNNTATVGFGSSIAGMIAEGDDFGIASSLKGSPSDWRTVIEVESSLIIHLDRVWNLPSIITPLWAAAEVSEMEQARRSVIRFAPAYYAYYMNTLITSGTQAAAGPFAIWQQMLAQIVEKTNIGDATKFDIPVRVGRFPGLLGMGR